MKDISDGIREIIKESIRVKQDFMSDGDGVSALEKAISAIAECYSSGGKVLVFGNGGSAADSQHMAAELVVRFEKEREAFPCVALTTDTSILTAASNDYGFENTFKRQVHALGRKGDVAFAISTSGRSPNVLEALRAARDIGMNTISLAGRDGGGMPELSDILILVKGDNTARIQETQATLIHVLCRMVEDICS